MAEYYITDGKQFVKQNANNQYKTVSNFAIADSFETAQKARSVLNNSIPKIWRKTYYVAKYMNGEFTKWTLSNTEKQEHIKDVSQQTDNKKTYKLNLYSFEEDEGVQTIATSFEMVNSALENTENMHFELQKELITLEAMLEDLKHYRLKKKLGTVNSYKFKKMEDEITLKRLSIKNQLELLYKINQYRTTLKDQVKEICQLINEIKNKTYTPRVLVDLFEFDNIDYVI